MQIRRMNNYSLVINSKGTIRSSLYQNYAKEYAKGIKANDIGWIELRQFINTIRAIKTDGKEDEFVFDIVPGLYNSKNWYIKYGDYCKKNELYELSTHKDDDKSIENLKHDALRKIVQFGKEYFGLRILNKPIKEFNKVNMHLKIASNYFAESRKPKNKSVAEKLISISQKHKTKAEDAIVDIKLEVINQL